MKKSIEEYLNLFKIELRIRKYSRYTIRNYCHYVKQYLLWVKMAPKNVHILIFTVKKPLFQYDFPYYK